MGNTSSLIWGEPGETQVAFRNWRPNSQNAKNNMEKAGKLQGTVLSLLGPRVATPDTVRLCQVSTKETECSQLVTGDGGGKEPN